MTSYSQGPAKRGGKNGRIGASKRTKEYPFGEYLARKKRSSAGKDRTYYGVIVSVTVIFFVLAFSSGLYAYRKTLEGVSLEEAKSAGKTVETVWIDFDPGDIAVTAEEYPVQPATEEIVPAAKKNADGYPYYDIPLSDEYQDIVIYFCNEYDVPLELVYSIMSVGSGFDDGLVSGTGDYGVMQINEINFAYLTNELGTTDYLDFSQNVHAGIYLLSGYYHKYADFDRTVMCYRYGETNAAGMWEEGITRTDYTEKAVRALASIKQR